MDFRRIKQVFEYGWKDALVISQEEGVQKGRKTIFLDIVRCFFKYNVWSNQYKKEKLHLLSGEQKKEICLKYREKNTKRDQWVKEFFDNYKFLVDYACSPDTPNNMGFSYNQINQALKRYLKIEE